MLQQELDAFLASHPGWERQEGAITRTYEFDGFGGSMGFVTRVALLAERADHHPDIEIRWNKVTLSLITHSAGGLTVKDLNLADEVDRLA